MSLKSEFIVKAKENLNAAELLFENKLYNASANRSYYAAFHAAITALSKEGFETERISHEAAQSFFAGELIKRKKKYPSSLKSYLTKLKDVRHNADYKSIQISKKIASRQLSKAQEFVRIVVKEVKDV
jgi:uncharacterized protein (UPF0332 family)